METSKPKEDWNTPSSEMPNQENKKILAGVLALLLGGIGVHKFI